MTSPRVATWPRSIARAVRRSRPGRWIWLVNLRSDLRRGPGWLHEARYRLAEYDLSTSGEREHSVAALTEFFFDLVRDAEVQQFVEVGAKDAHASVRAAALPGIETVIAFEANPYTYRRFAAALEEAGVDYRHLAVGDHSGTVTFLVRRRDDGSPIADGQGSLLVRPDHEPGYEQVDVGMVSLDEHVDAPDGARTALWIDVEGASAAVLRGATALLDDVDAVMIEVEEQTVWEGQEWLRRDVVDAMAASGLEPVARDRQSRHQFNLVFVRSVLAREPWVVASRRRWAQKL